MDMFKTGMKVLNKGTRAINKSVKENARIQKGIMQFQESLELAQTSPNPDTRVSRMRVATQKLAHMIQEFPFASQRKEWEKTYKELVAAYPNFFVANISKIILTDVPKIEALKSQASKAGRAAKLAAKIQSYIGQCPEADRWITEQVGLIKEAFPPEGAPASPISLPSEWDGGELTTTTQPINAEPFVKNYRTVGWLGITLIWFGCFVVAAIIGNLVKNEIVSALLLGLSFVVPYYIVKDINRRRAEKAQKL